MFLPTLSHSLCDRQVLSNYHFISEKIVVVERMRSRSHFVIIAVDVVGVVGRGKNSEFLKEKRPEKFV